MRTSSLFIFVGLISASSALLLGAPKAFIQMANSIEIQDSRAKEGSMEQQVVSKEREELEAVKAGDLERLGSLIAEDAILLDTQGTASKAQAHRLRDGRREVLADLAQYGPHHL